jgi:hypothetical protein
MLRIFLVLQHLPMDLALETKLPKDLAPRLAFARQKLSEIVRVAQTPLPPVGSAAAGEVLYSNFCLAKNWFQHPFTRISLDLIMLPI